MSIIRAHKREEQPRYALLRASARFCAWRFPASGRNLGRTAAGRMKNECRRDSTALGGKSKQTPERAEYETNHDYQPFCFEGLAAVAVFGLPNMVKAAGDLGGDCMRRRVVLCGIGAGLLLRGAQVDDWQAGSKFQHAKRKLKGERI